MVRELGAAPSRVNRSDGFSVTAASDLGVLETGLLDCVELHLLSMVDIFRFSGEIIDLNVEVLMKRMAFGREVENPFGPQLRI